MIFRLTAPNWERPSPDYGSHIIMSISGIYLLISIQHIISFTSPTFNSGARDNIFPSHTMSRQIYVCSLQQSGTDWPLSAGLSLYSISWTLVGGRTVPSVLDLGYRRRALHLPPADQSGHQCACPTTFASKYRSALDVSRTTSSDK